MKSSVDRTRSSGVRLPLRGTRSATGATRAGPSSGTRPIDLDSLAAVSRPSLRDLCTRASELDLELRRLSQRDAEGRRVLGLLAHRFIELRGYELAGFARLSDYTCERLGCSSRQIEEAARVAHSLSGLPETERAFLENRIGWSKLRLLVSLVTPEDEARWLEVAGNTDVRTLSALTRNARSAAREERRVGGFSGDADSSPTSSVHFEEAEEEEEERVLMRIECNRRTRLLWSDVRRAAVRMAGRALAPWQVAELVAAEASTTPGPYAAVWEEEPWKSLAAIHSKPRSRFGSARSRVFSRRAEGPALFSTSGVERDCSFAHELDDLATKDAFDLDAAMRRVQLAMQRSDSELGRALAQFAELRLYEEFGYHSLAAYACERLGMSERSARNLVSMERSAGRFAELADAYSEGRLSWMQVRVLVPVLTPVNASAWIQRAQDVTLRRLTDETEWAMRLADQSPLHAALMPPARDSDLGLDASLMQSPRKTDRQNVCGRQGPDGHHRSLR